MQGLTHRQERFIEEYLLDLNATRAAIRAGYSPRSAAACGWTLLQKPAIQDGIERAMEERRMRVSVDQDRVIEELAAVAFGNLTDFVRVERDDEGQMCLRLTPTEQVEKRLRPALADIRLKDGRDGKMEFSARTHDKMRALELLGRHLGVWKDKPEGDGRLEIIIDYSGVPSAKESEEQAQ